MLYKLSTLTEFIDKAKKVHGDRYNYSKAVYINSMTKICIICPDHGEFWQTPKNHIQGSGCQSCSNKLPKELILDRFKKIHIDNFDYSLMEYEGMNKKIKIRCKKHDYIFEQTPNSHCKGSECPICRYEKSAKNKKLDWNEVLNRFKDKHGNEFNYDNFIYTTIDTPSLIICKKHGDFLQSPASHFSGCKCPKCNWQISKPETEIKDFLENLDYKVMINNRRVIAPYELDIYIPEIKKAIEFNGKHWHYSDKFFRPGYHAMKSNLCRDKGIKLLHIREDLWRKDKEKMKEVIIKFIKRGN